MTVNDNIAFGFVLGIVTAAFIGLIIHAFAVFYADSVVIAAGHTQPYKKIRVGNDLWVKDFEYEVTPSNAAVTVKFAPRKDVETK